MMDNNQAAVDELLGMYAQYKQAQAEESRIAHQLAKAKLLRNDVLVQQLSAQHSNTERTIQTISDAMTFANPIIWMMYKFAAYQHEAQPIRTMQDFRVHCSKDGYICTKRFLFLDAALEQHGFTSLRDTGNYPDLALLSTAYESHELKQLVEDENFMKTWNSYEFYEIDGAVHKWQNFTAN